MSLIIPNTFAIKSGIVELADLDENFTYLGSQLDTTNNSLTSLSSSITTLNTNLNVTTWTITESGGSLYFKSNGVNKMKLDSNGNLSVTGDVIAYETL